MLDVGCGTKPYAALFAGRTDLYLGCDRPSEVDEGRHDRAARAGAPDVHADVLALPFTDACFDTVLCTQVFEHVNEPARLVAECARVLRPGGVFLATAPFVHELHEEPFDFFRFSPHGLAELTRAAGLHAERIEPIGGTGAALGYHAHLHLTRLVPVRPLRWVAGAAGLALQLGGRALDRLAPAQTRLPLDHLVVARKLPPAGATR